MPAIPAKTCMHPEASPPSFSRPPETNVTRVLPSNRPHQQPGGSSMQLGLGQADNVFLVCGCKFQTLHFHDSGSVQLRDAVPPAVALSTRAASWPALACFEVRLHASPCPHCSIEALPFSSPCTSLLAHIGLSFRFLPFSSQLSVCTAVSCHVCSHATARAGAP
jgi:hypothetical protein